MVDGGGVEGGVEGEGESQVEGGVEGGVEEGVEGKVEGGVETGLTEASGGIGIGQVDNGHQHEPEPTRTLEMV
jgi:hypothetical protein